MVLPPRLSPLRTMDANAIRSTPPWSMKRLSSTAMMAFFIASGISFGLSTTDSGNKIPTRRRPGHHHLRRGHEGAKLLRLEVPKRPALCCTNGASGDVNRQEKETSQCVLHQRQEPGTRTWVSDVSMTAG